MLHLLQWQIQPERRALAGRLAEAVARPYGDAIIAADETALPESAFPDVCP